MRPQPDANTINLLTELLRLAQAGSIAGLAVVSLYRPGAMDKKFGVSLSGLAKTNPTMAVGAMDTCTMLIKEIALKEAGIG